MKHLVFLLFLITALISCITYLPPTKGETSSTVFLSGSDNYSYSRIPAIIYSNKILYAFSEATQNSVDDNGKISLVLKRSFDQGKTWGPLIKVMEIEGESVQNPTLVFLQKGKKLIVLFTKRTEANDTEFQLRNGTSKGYVGVYCVESHDYGQSWLAVKEITNAVKKDNWRWYTVGPGGAIIIKYNKKNVNRIIIPSNHSTSEGPENEFLGAHVIYSDDNAKTWHIGACDSEGENEMNPNETYVIELINGDLYFNTRNQSSTDTLSNRGMAISKDGGNSFPEKFTHEKQLITPVVHASMTRTAKSIFFIAPFSSNKRENLSIWRSNDEAKSWNYDKLIYQGSSAYSSSCTLSENQLGILFEADDYSRIIFKTVSIE